MSWLNYNDASVLQSHMDRKSANYKQRLSHMMETLKLDMEAELIEKVPLIVKSVEEVIGEAAVRKIDEFLIQVILSKLEGVRGVSANFGAILAENVRQLTNRTRYEMILMNFITRRRHYIVLEQEAFIFYLELVQPRKTGKHPNRTEKC